jgi:hypothetical protein
MKRGLILALVLFFGMVAVASAGPVDVGNTSQQGSVLIFPKIDVSGGRDTIISISNGNNVPVFIECYWVDSNQNWQDFMFELTANQPIAFSALYGISGDTVPVTVPPFPACDSPVGELKCWAVDNGGANQINFNFLTGSAKVIDYDYFTAYEYNAWTFDARTGTTGAAVGTGGLITLDGVNFDACPQYFLGNFFATGADYGFFKTTDLTLVPCKQDVRQDRVPTYTKAKFDIWNENEVEYSGAYQCFKCWFENYLCKISDKFTFCSLHTAAARFRTTGIASTVCNFGTAASPVYAKATPLIGLLVEELDFSYGKIADTAKGCQIAKTASTGFGAGIDTTGFIAWDPLAAPVSAKKPSK